MTPEQLKVIAEGIGCIVRDNNLNNRIIVWNGKDIHTRQKFNPLDDNNLAMEIMIKCGISVMVDNQGDGRYATVWDTDISVHEMSTDKDDSAMVRRLICKAAYEDLK